MDDLPVPTCLKRTRPHPELASRLFIQLVMKSRKARRVPTRQPLLGPNRELTVRGISLMIASSFITIIESVTQKASKATYGQFETWLDRAWNWVDNFTTLSRIWNTVDYVEMTAWFRKAFQRLTRASDNSLISSSLLLIFFNVRFPEDNMFTKANEVRRQCGELRVLCIWPDKVVATTNILQYECKASGKDPSAWKWLKST